MMGKKKSTDNPNLEAGLLVAVMRRIKSHGECRIPDIRQDVKEQFQVSPHIVTKKAKSAEFKELLAAAGLEDRSGVVRQASDAWLDDAEVRHRLLDNTSAKDAIAGRVAKVLIGMLDEKRALRVFFGPGTLSRQCAIATGSGSSRGLEFMTNNLLIAVDAVRGRVTPYTFHLAPGEVVPDTVAIRHLNASVLESWFDAHRPQASVVSFHRIAASDASEEVVFSADRNSDVHMLLETLTRTESKLLIVAASNKFSEVSLGKPVLRLRDGKWFDVHSNSSDEQQIDIKADVHFVTDDSDQNSFVARVKSIASCADAEFEVVDV